MKPRRKGRRREKKANVICLMSGKAVSMMWKKRWMIKRCEFVSRDKLCVEGTQVEKMYRLGMSERARKATSGMPD